MTTASNATRSCSGVDETPTMLKTWPAEFQAIVDKKKTHEVRPADRPFKVDDLLLLQEWLPAHEDACAWYSPYDEQQTEQSDFRCKKCGRRKKDSLPGTYSGRVCLVKVTFITPPGRLGMPASYLAMSIELLTHVP